MNWCELKYYDWLTWMISLLLFSWMVVLSCLILEAAREDSHYLWLAVARALGTGLWMLSIWVSYLLIARGKICLSKFFQYWQKNNFQRSSSIRELLEQCWMSFTKTKPQKKRQRHSESEMENGQGLLHCIYDYGGGLSSIWKNILASGYNTLLVSSFIQSLCFLPSDFRVFNALTFTKANVSLFTIEHK